MSEKKFIDLAPQIASMHDQPLGTMRVVLGLLDEFASEHPDQLPGRTITQSEFRDAYSAFGDMDGPDCYGSLLDLLGITVTPDPKPTNAEHDRDWWVENANVNDAEDCEACEGDLCPVHYGISMGIDLMAKKIAALGDDPELFALIPDPVKAPGGDDE